MFVFLPAARQGALRSGPRLLAETFAFRALANALAHAELAVTRTTEDEQRPGFHCRVLCNVGHAPFQGFQPRQAAADRGVNSQSLYMLLRDKIEREIAYLEIAVSKTASPAEQEAWTWSTTNSALLRVQREPCGIARSLVDSRANRRRQVAKHPPAAGLCQCDQNSAGK